MVRIVFKNLAKNGISCTEWEEKSLNEMADQYYEKCPGGVAIMKMIRIGYHLVAKQ